MLTENDSSMVGVGTSYWAFSKQRRAGRKVKGHNVFVRDNAQSCKGNRGKVHPCTGTEGSRGIAILYRH